MMRRCFSAALVLFVLGGFVIAESYRGIVTSLDDKEVKVTVRKKGDKKGEAKTFEVAKKITFAKKGKGKDATDESLTAKEAAELVTKGAESKAKGAPATVETDDDGKVTKIIFGGGRRGKGKAKDTK